MIMTTESLNTKAQVQTLPCPLLSVFVQKPTFFVSFGYTEKAIMKRDAID